MSDTPPDTPEGRLAAMGIELPSPPRPAANYLTAVRTGSLLYTSGHGPVLSDGTSIAGKVGVDVDIDLAVQAARLTGLNLLATLRSELGSLNSVVRIVKVLGLVNCSPEFTMHPTVIDGCSDLLVEVFGDAGRHARSAVGMTSLPFDITVEIELVAEITVKHATLL